jgi:hypothetical protein
MSKHQYNIAVMLPTHKRTDALSRSVMSLINLANDLDSIQFIFGIDSNDNIGMNHFISVLQPELDKKDVNYVALEFEPLGYGKLNQYYNKLSESADADWLFVWCDDAIMETPAWDQRITECTGEFKLLKVHTHNEHPYSIFPIIPVEWLNVFGFLSRHQLIDAEVSQMAYVLDIMKIIDVHVTHDRADLTGNNADENAAKKQYFEGNPNNPLDFHYQPTQQQRYQDINRLAEYMKQQGLDTSFWENVKNGKQDPWERMRANDPNGQTTDFKIKEQIPGHKVMVKINKGTE